MKKLKSLIAFCFITVSIITAQKNSTANLKLTNKIQFNAGIGTLFGLNNAFSGKVGLQINWNHFISTELGFERGLIGLGNNLHAPFSNFNWTSNTSLFALPTIIDRAIENEQTSLESQYVDVSNYNELVGLSKLEFNILFHSSFKRKRAANIWGGIGACIIQKSLFERTRFYSDSRLITTIDEFSADGKRTGWGLHAKIGYNVGNFRQLFGLYYNQISTREDLFNYGQFAYLELTTTFGIPLKFSNTSPSNPLNLKKGVFSIGGGFGTPIVQTTHPVENIFFSLKWRLNSTLAIGTRIDSYRHLRRFNHNVLDVRRIHLFAPCHQDSIVFEFNRYGDDKVPLRLFTYQFIAEKYYWQQNNAIILGLGAGVSRIREQNFHDQSTPLSLTYTRRNEWPACSDRIFPNRLSTKDSFTPAISARIGYWFRGIRTNLYFDYAYQTPLFIGMEMEYDLFGRREKQK